jgi:uncharacterized protein
MHKRFDTIIKAAMSSKGKGKKKEAAKESISLCTTGDIKLQIAAKPNSKESAIVGISEDGIEVKIGAPAMEGEANEELIKFLSKTLKCRKSDLSLEKGSKSRSKVITVSKDTGLTVDKIKEIVNSNSN